MNDPHARIASAARATALLDEIEALLRGGHKLHAIKAYRTSTGSGLKEAKGTVDAIERAMGLPGPCNPSPFGRLVQTIASWRRGRDARVR